MKKFYDVFACVDCGYYLANGMPEEHDPSWSPSLIKERWDGYHIVNGDGEKDHDFSWTPCELCDSTLGGYRYHCVAWDEDQ